MRHLIFISLLLLCACSKKSADHAAQSTAISGSCQLQSSVPAPQYGSGIKINTYLCPQFSPACFYEILIGEPFDQVPGPLSTNCPSIPPANQVPR